MGNKYVYLSVFTVVFAVLLLGYEYYQVRDIQLVWNNALKFISVAVCFIPALLGYFASSPIAKLHKSNFVKRVYMYFSLSMGFGLTISFYFFLHDTLKTLPVLLLGLASGFIFMVLLFFARLLQKLIGFNFLYWYADPFEKFEGR